jgi:hypothetical protein
VTGDSERLDGVGVSSTEEGAEGGTVKSPLSLGHESLGQVDGERRIRSEDISSVSGSSLETEVLGGTLETEEIVDELGIERGSGISAASIRLSSISSPPASSSPLNSSPP